MERALTERPYEMRRHERRPSDQPVQYLVSTIEEKNRTWLSCKGQLIDISEAGICIQTHHPLSPGHIVWFNGATEDTAGFVRWCRQLNSIYKIGIELDKIHIRKLDDATDLFNARLDEIEKRCENPSENPHELYAAIMHAVDDVLSACEAFERVIKDKDIIRDTRVRFREKTNSLLSKSYFINRARTWPQGYQGDYKMLEGIYRNSPLSKGFGYYLDLGFLNSQLAIAVKNRIVKLETILRNELQKRQKASVLNIACGSCREVFALAADIENSKAQFTCIDLDNDALSFAANRLSQTNLSLVSSDQVVFRKYNAVRMFDHELNMSEFGMQDIIYSVGFFDYLSSDFLSNLFRSLHDLLNPGGGLLTSFKDADRYRHQDYHWLVDWDGFLQRTEDDFRKIFHDADIPESSISEFREETGTIVFYLVKK